MEDSGPTGTNTNDAKSPFAPVDIPDLNNIPAQGAMPPMGVPMAGSGSNAGNAMKAGIPGGNAGTGAMQPSQPVNGGAQQVNSGAMTGTKASANTRVPAGGAGQTSPKKEQGAVDGVTMADIPIPKIMSDKEGTEGKTGTKSEAEEKKGGAVDLTPKSTDMAPAVTPTNVEIAVDDLIQAGTSAANNGLTIEPLLEDCIRQNASDLHLQAGLPPILRIDGALRPITTYEPLDDATVQRLVFSTLDSDQKMILIKDKEFDYSFAYGDLGRFRVNAFHEKGNMAAAFRLIPNVITSIEDLGLPQIVATFADHPSGLVLVTGPTGSGKSTTLAALIDKINSDRAEHIITIEDPIEFTHQSKRSVVAQREVHYDTFSFAAALRSILREDPDVVLIGEMRDLETIQAAITTAETGHLVFATLHTNSAAQSIDRMIDVFPAHQQPQIRSQLANILVGICSQRLVPAINGGRVAVTEIMVTNSAVRSIIREGKTHQLDMTIQTGMSQGMQTMDRELAKFVRGGIISYDVARGYAVDVVEFDRLAKG